MVIDLSLGKLEYLGLIRQVQLEPELEYMFRHALVQDASYESLLKSDRRALHLTVGQTLEKLYPSRFDELAATLADHYEKAEVYSKALEYYLRAGKAAARVYANAEAGALFSRAIEIVSIPESQAGVESTNDAFSQYGRVLELSGKYEAAIENYRQMQAEAIRRRERSMEMDALIAQAIIQATPSPIHDIQQAQSLCEQALGIAEVLQNREAESRIYWILVLVNYFAQDHQKSVGYGKKSLEIARAINHRERMAFTLNDVARSYYAMGDFENATAAIIEARSLWEELGNQPMLADNLTSYAEAQLLTGEFDEALALAQRARAIAKKINNAWGQGYSLSIQAQAYWYRGDTMLCLQCFDAIKELTSEENLPFVAFMNATMFMEIYTEIGDYDKAQHVIDTAFHSAKEFANESFKGLYETACAYIASARGDTSAARENVNIARQKVTNTSFNTFAPLYFGAVEYRLAMDAGEYAKIAEKITTHIQELQVARIDIFVPLLMCWRGDALLHSDLLDDARIELTAAMELSERFGTRHTTWRIHSALASVSAQLGDPAAESFHRQKARATIEYIADRIPEELRDRYLSLPELQRIMSEP